MVGNAVEWFDYGVYGYITIYIAQLFFSNDLLGTSSDSSLPLILTLATFAISFVVRPLGALVLGPLGDRIGRKRLLVFTVIAISGATTLIGVLPTAASVGALAPILLILLRMVQGFAAGGEYSAAAVFLAEHAPDRRRGFYVSFLEVGTWGGLSVAALLGTGLAHLVGDQGMLDGWWRLPFLVSLPLGLVGLFIRSRLVEPATFIESQHEHRGLAPKHGPLFTVVTRYPGQLFKLMGFTITLNVSIYIVIAYLPSLVADANRISSAALSYSLVAVQILICVAIVPLGALSDRIGRKPPVICACVWFILFSVPAMMLINQSSPVLQFLGIAALGVPVAVCAALTSSTLPALFPTPVRNTGFAISYNLATVVFGGTAPALTVWLVDMTGNDLIPGWYLVVVGVIGLIAILTFAETKGVSLRGDHVPGRPVSSHSSGK